jgi:outer membrane murein-binding lipoprotein Lpp
MVKYILTGVLSAASVGATGFNYVSNLHTQVTTLQTQNSQLSDSVKTKNEAIESAIKALERARDATPTH